MIAFQQNSSGRLLPITLKNYLIMFERVAKLSGKKKKYIYIYIYIYISEENIGFELEGI